MKYLLDTSIWLWNLGGATERINSKGREVLADGTLELYLSAASSWEISIKMALGKLRLPDSPVTYVPKRLADQDIRPLPITHLHALSVYALPGHHQDPFDRLIISQAKAEEMVILTADRAFQKYDV